MSDRDQYREITVEDGVSEWEMRGCDHCDPDKYRLKYGRLNECRVVHVLLHDRQAACDQANEWGHRFFADKNGLPASSHLRLVAAIARSVGENQEAPE